MTPPEQFKLTRSAPVEADRKGTAKISPEQPEDALQARRFRVMDGKAWGTLVVGVAEADQRNQRIRPPKLWAVLIQLWAASIVGRLRG